MGKWPMMRCWEGHHVHLGAGALGQELGGDVLAARGVPLDGALALGCRLGGVGGKSFRSSFANLANLLPSVSDRTVPRLRMQRLIRLLPPPREQRPLGSGQVRPAQVLVALGDDSVGQMAIKAPTTYLCLYHRYVIPDS
jgi:hypothetical protein